MASLPGRYVFNLLSERMSPQTLLYSSIITQAIGIALLILAPSVGWLIVYVVVYGAAYGAISPLRGLVMANHVGRRAYGSITAIQGIPIALCAAFGPTGRQDGSLIACIPIHLPSGSALASFYSQPWAS